MPPPLSKGDGKGRKGTFERDTWALQSWVGAGVGAEVGEVLGFRTCCAMASPAVRP